MKKQPELMKLHNGDVGNGVPKICNGLNASHKQKPLGEQRKAVLRQELMVFLGNTGVLGTGMAMAIPSVTLEQLTNPKESFYLTNEESSWFSSINTMACPLGGLLVSYLMDRIGRKRTIFFTNLTGILGWALLAAAPLHETRDAIYIQILIARFISGIMIGLFLSPVGVYSAEISLPRIRGRLILGTSLGIAAGILFMYVLGYIIRNDWQLIAIISCVYQVVATLCVLPMPETPSWLMQQGRPEKAHKSLRYFRGLRKNDSSFCDDFQVEIAQIRKTAGNNRGDTRQDSFLNSLRLPEVYKPLLRMIGFFIFQQCSGVVVVIVFAVQISERAGVTMDPLLVAVFVGVARIITTFFMSVIFEKWGRKPAGLTSATGMSACMLLLAAGGWYPDLTQYASILAAICVIMYIVFSTMGLLTLPFFMISEVFPQRVRGAASGITVSLGLMFSFGIIKLYPVMDEVMGTANVFAFYGFVSLAAVPYIFFLIPETRGRTLLEIEEYFRSGRRMSQAPLAQKSSTIHSSFGDVEANATIDEEVKVLVKN